MQTTEDRAALVELGSVTADTKGEGGVLIETFTLMPKAGITAD